MSLLTHTNDKTLRRIDEAWAYLTNGDLMLTPDELGEKLNEEQESALVMFAQARQCVDLTAAAQFGASGEELVGNVDDDEIARRVAVAIHVLHYGIPA